MEIQPASVQQIHAASVPVSMCCLPIAITIRGNPEERKVRVTQASLFHRLVWSFLLVSYTSITSCKYPFDFLFYSKISHFKCGVGSPLISLPYGVPRLLSPFVAFISLSHPFFVLPKHHICFFRYTRHEFQCSTLALYCIRPDGSKLCIPSSL